jgi:hypothetical protein
MDRLVPFAPCIRLVTPSREREKSEIVGFEVMMFVLFILAPFWRQRES